VSASDFREIPDIVWKLFDEAICWGEPIQLLQPEERMRALTLVWYWNPPLMKRSSRSSLTGYGLAAYCWRQEEAKARGAEPNRYGWFPCSYDLVKTETNPKKNPFAKKDVNPRMFAEMSQNNEAYYWTLKEWADFLGCSKPSVSAAPAWQFCQTMQMESKAERGKPKDRRRRAKGSDQRRASEEDD
jgi:hypothetical protein